MSKLTFVSIWIGDRLRNHATVRHIGDRLTFYSHRRSTKEPCYCETYSVEQVLEICWVSLYTFTAQLNHVNSNVWADLCFYSHRRSTKELCYCETYSVEQELEIWWVSLYTFTAQFKHFNSTINISISKLTFVSIPVGDRLRTHTDVRHILWSKW